MQARAYHNAALTTVYVVEGTIPQGTPAATAVSDNLVKQAKIPQQFKPANAVTDLATVQGEVAVADLTSGEVLSSSLFVSPASALSTAAAAIPKGDVAVTVSVNSNVQEVAGLVQPGDQVDVLVLMSGKEERFLYQNARVLAIGTSVATSTNGAPQVASATPTTTPVQASDLVTFAVPPVAAERLAFVESGGGGVASDLYLALVPPHSRARREPPIAVGDLIPASVTPG